MVENAIEGCLGFGVAPLTGFNNPFRLRDRIAFDEENDVIFRLIHQNNRETCFLVPL